MQEPKAYYAAGRWIALTRPTSPATGSPTTFEGACYAGHVVETIRQGGGKELRAMEQVSDQSRQYLERGFAELLRFIQVVWEWSSDQFVKVTQAQWGSWPLWKQIVFAIVIAAVLYFLFVAALQLWTAALRVLAAFATFIGTVIVTLPTIFIAGLIAMAGLWILNNFHDLSDLRSLITFHNPAGSQPHVDAP